MKTKRSKRTEIWVTLVLILMGLSCIAYSSWSWAGASAYCWRYADGWGTASGSVSWGGMSSGNWSTYANLNSHFTDDGSGGIWTPGGGESSYVSGEGAWSATASGSISGTGLDGQYRSDYDSDYF